MYTASVQVFGGNTEQEIEYVSLSKGGIKYRTRFIEESWQETGDSIVEAVQKLAKRLITAREQKHISLVSQYIEVYSDAKTEDGRPPLVGQYRVKE